MQNPFTLVIFGATGNLYAHKLAKALYLLFQEGKLPDKFTIIAFARKDMTNENFRAFTKESILGRGDIDISRLDDFLSHVEYFKGDFSEQQDFVKLKNFILNFPEHEENGQILLHVATAAHLYEKIFKNIHFAGLETTNGQNRIMIEKPFGKNQADAKHLQKVLSDIFKEKNIFHVDHYLAKETARNILDFRWGEGSAQNKWENDTIKKIKVVFHESNIVGSRGSFYDAAGAFADVGQNHMLQLLALTIMDKPSSLGAEDIQISRAKVLEDLHIDKNKRITKGQYEGYLLEPGVNPNSATETFFRIFLSSKNPEFSNVEFELEAGKGLVDMHSDITTTVAVEVYFKSGSKKEFKIQPVSGTVYESYTKVYADALKGDQTFFVSFKEILLEWKLADELSEKWKNIPLIIYKKFSTGEKIK